MSGYWNTVPKGIWSIVDPSDVLDVLRDEETRWTLDFLHNRVNLFGPDLKALILDLKEFENFSSSQEYKEVLSVLETSPT